MSRKLFQKVLLIAIICSSPSYAVAFGERPAWKKPDTPVTNTAAGTQQDALAKTAVPSAPSDFAIARDTVQKLIQKKSYSEAYQKLAAIPVASQTDTDQIQLRQLAMVLTVRDREKSQSELLKSDDEIDAATLKQVKALYEKAEQTFVEGQTDIAKDFLVHTLFLHRRFFNARELLKVGYGLAPGTYKVEDIQSKYWKQSETFFYGGNYERALSSLDTLTNFDKENYKVYERMGSTYYMLGERRKAVEAWTTALFLHPGDEQLQYVIDKTKKLIEEDDKKAEEEKAAQSQKVEKKATSTQEETQLLGVFPTQTQAYAYAQKLREQKLNALVEETENGKWAVKVPKSQLSKGTKP